MAGKRKIRFLFFLWVSLFLSIMGYSQEVMDTVIHIREVSVRAIKPINRDAIVVSSIDSISLSGNKGYGLDQLLAANSVVHIRSYGYGGLATVSFRGTAPSHTKLYWNDLEINDPASGQVDFSLIPAGFVDELQLMHGSSALQEGGGALGGSICLNSVPDWKDRFSAELIQQSASFNTHHSYFSLSGSKSDYFAKLRIYREASDNDFSYINNANGLWNKEKMKGASSSRSGFQLDLYRKFKAKNIVSVHNWIQQSDRDLPPVMSYMGPGRQENQKDAAVRLAIRWKHYGTYVNSKLSSGISLNEMTYFLAENESSKKVYDTHSRSGNYFLRHEAESKFSAQTKIRSLVDVDYFLAKYTNLSDHSGYNAFRPSAGWTVSLHHRFDMPFSVYMLLREEITGNIFSPLIPAAGIHYSPNNLSSFSLKANVSRNYHYPGLNDLYWIPGGNPDLKPEEGYMSDLSAQVHWKRERIELKTSLTTYYSAINDWILWKPGDYGFWRASNIDRVISRGLEYIFHVKIESGKSLMRLTGTYSWTRASDQSLKDTENDKLFRQLVYIPEHKTNMNVFMKYRKFSLSYQLYYSGKQYTTTDNDPYYAIPSFGLHDAKISRDFIFHGISTTASIGVYNIYNTSYQVIRSRPMPGRNFSAEIKVKF